jgi:phenylacetate-coenzyme A ligase PaaK-like adenylate-forming protein
VPYNISLINPEDILHANAADFENIALQVFYYQYHHNALYRQYADMLRRTPGSVTRLADIPFLPISFFKTHRVVSDEVTDTPLVFESSGTSGEVTSRHYVADEAIYEQNLLQGFEQFYGDVKQYTILALLPSYLERKNASLVYMVKTLMEKSGRPANGFYINEWQQLHDTLIKLGQSGEKVLLLGVTFALLDFAAAYPMQLKNAIVMETGGMKGRREELTRAEVHDLLKSRWQLQQIHSEYGMTEMLSQAYATTEGIFRCANTMRAVVRDINDPLDVKDYGTGCLNIIDLANIYSCSFIATDDIGQISADGSFQVLGRMDNSALRGCNLMVI